MMLHNLKRSIKKFLHLHAVHPPVHPTLLHAPPGHFYSPLPEPSEFQDPANPVFDSALRELPGIEVNADGQQAMLESLLPYLKQFPGPSNQGEGSGNKRFNFEQCYFKEADAMVLFAMLSHFKPGKVVEVGSGHSSALMLDTVEVLEGYGPKFTFVEPYPERLRTVLRVGDESRARILTKRVQDVPVEEFLALGAGDLLFIDSSHVSKIGSDVNFLFFEVLPRLEPGVIIHVHDIFWPFEYPREWIQEGRAWNEAYLLRALLTGSTMFEILFWNSYCGLAQRQRLEKDCPLYLKNCGGSIYLRKKR
jgi:predicted O-methyltransferase YrrM